MLAELRHVQRTGPRRAQLLLTPNRDALAVGGEDELERRARAPERPHIEARAARANRRAHGREAGPRARQKRRV